MKQKKEMREKVKTLFVKGLNVFCYVVSAVAVILAIAMGVNSCSGSNEVNRIDPQQVETPKALRFTDIGEKMDYVSYEPIYSVGTHSVDFDYLRNFFDISASLTPVQGENITKSVYFDPSASYWIGDDGTLHSFSRLRFTFVSYPVDSYASQYEYKLETLYLTDDTSSQSLAIYYRSSEYSTGDDGLFSRSRLVLSQDEVENEAFLAFWRKVEKQEFVFNSSFNYNAPFGLPYNAVYGSSISWSGGGDTMKYMTYNIGWFASNGRLFDQIKWWAIKGDGVAVVIDNVVTQLPAGDNWVYTFMYYVNSVSGEEVLVNSRDSLPYNGGNSRYYANSSTWQVPAYRNITLLTTLSDTIVDLLGSFNNNNAYDTGLSGGGQFGDVFALVASAFTGLLPILTLQILPSVTIGTLLFVPLVAMLVFAIIRIIKK